MTSSHDPQSDSYFEYLAATLAVPSEECVPVVSVKDLIEAAQTCLGLTTASSTSTLDSTITSARIHPLGLALFGFPQNLKKGSISLLCPSEATFLETQPIDLWEGHLTRALEIGPGCLLVAANRTLPPRVHELAESVGIPILSTPRSHESLVIELNRILFEQLAPRVRIHGNLLVISGLGVLILGKSGIGKSDDALDLIMNGHQLVADDVVEILRTPTGKLVGRSDPLTRHHMNIRGLGIVNIKDLYGITSVLDHHPIDLIIYLEHWDAARTFACFREVEHLAILEQQRPLLRLPVAPSRNLENLIEVAVKNFALQASGSDSAEILAHRLRKKLYNQDKE